MAEREQYICPMCQRSHISDYMTLHHLFPSVGLLPKDGPTIYICSTCHTVIHFVHTNEELRFVYNSLETLLESPKVLAMLDLYKYKADNCVFKIKRLKHMLKCA
jgi:hypothetical protein